MHTTAHEAVKGLVAVNSFYHGSAGRNSDIRLGNKLFTYRAIYFNNRIGTICDLSIRKGIDTGPHLTRDLVGIPFKWYPSQAPLM